MLSYFNSIKALPKNLKGLGRKRETLQKMQAAFDPDFYRYCQPDRAVLSDEAMFKKYVETDWKNGADPNAEFSTRLYLANNPDVAAAGINPFYHYVSIGKREQRLAFISQWNSNEGGITASGHLDMLLPEMDLEYLRVQLPETVAELSDRAVVSYFIENGRDGSLRPTEHFNVSNYINRYPDVAAGRQNGFVHFIVHGRAEGRLTHHPADEALQEKTTSRTELLRDMDLAKPFFDAEYYRSEYSDITGNDEDALMHYLLFGWREARNPSADFDTSEYLRAHPELLETNVCPLLHRNNSVQVEEDAKTKKTGTLQLSGVSENDLASVRGFFEPAFYRAMYEDVTGSDEDLLLHFMTTGWRERRDPNREFSTSHYLESYADIAGAGLNPFLHYVLFGRKEGRRARGDEPMGLMVNPYAGIVPSHLGSVMRHPPKGLRKPKPLKTTNAHSMDLHWVIPDFARGSGGHLTIFRMIRHLEFFGHRCHIWIEAPMFHETGHEAWEKIVKYFQCVQAPVDFVENGFFAAKGDAVIATGWSTAYLAERSTGFAGKFYFVQDHEPEFYPTGSEQLLAKATYGFDLDCICASPWLDKIMTETYGRWARHFYLAYGRDVYHITDEAAHKARFATKLDGPYKIAVYARDHTARRCVSLALMALEKLGHKRQDFEVHFFGQDDLPFMETNFPAMNHGVLDTHKLAALYNDCHMGICFSATNYSLVPQEMMACGLPLLELNVESTQAIFPSDVVSLGGPNPDDIVAKIEALLDKPKTRKAQVDAALKWVSKFTWEGAAEAVEGAIKERMADRTTLAAPPKTRTRKIELDVVIPTYNGLGELEPVIESLREQRNRDAIQIYCVDSSSSDGTIEWLKKQSDISTTVIDQKDFQHGRTRNDGAALGKAPIVSFLTQDAIPTNGSWGADIVKMFNHMPDAAGLFGRHKPYPDHPEYVRNEITNHFANMLKHPLALSKYTDPEKWASGDRGWRQLLHFYSDNNSAMRRDIWKDIPYAEVDYGEDQVWARDIVEAGYTKLYSPTACVYHSHDYDPKETYKRSKIEGAFFYEHFGYELSNGTDEEIAKRVKNEQMHFKLWAKTRNTDATEVEMRLKNIAEKYRGWKDGRLNAMCEKD